VLSLDPVRVPPELWARPDVQEALSRRDLGGLLRIVRRHAGVSQSRIAAATGMSQPQVSGYERGRRRATSMQVWERAADGLGMPDVARATLGVSGSRSPIPCSRTATTVTRATEEDEHMKRRKFLAHAATVTVGAFLPHPELLSTVGDPGPSPLPARVGATDVAQVEAVTRTLRALDYQYGGGACRDAVLAQLSRTRLLLEADSSDNVRNDLMAAVADLHNLAGWTDFDCGIYESARFNLTKALEFAKAAARPSLMANVLYRMGRVQLHHGWPDDGLKLLQLGQIAAQDSGCARTVAMLCASEALAYADLGDAPQVVSSLGRAKDELARANTSAPGSWVQFFGEAEMVAMSGVAHAALARRDRRHCAPAIEALTQSISSRGAEMARSQVFELTALATTHLRNGDNALGAEIGHKAVDQASTMRSQRVFDRLRPLRHEAHRHGTDSSVQQIAARISVLSIA
jgi:transcriptional regulator with XRE-family HTH domain